MKHFSSKFLSFVSVMKGLYFIFYFIFIHFFLGILKKTYFGPLEICCKYT